MYEFGDQQTTLSTNQLLINDLQFVRNVQLMCIEHDDNHIGSVGEPTNNFCIKQIIINVSGSKSQT